MVGLRQVATGDIGVSMPESCSECRDSGWLITERGAKPCLCTSRRRKARRLRAIAREFRDASFATYEPRSEQQKRALMRMATSPENNFYLTGPYGRGKTHLLVSQYRALIDRKGSLLRSALEVFDELEAARFERDYIPPVLQLQDSGGHLFMDDLDKFKPTDFKDEVLFGLVDGLYRNQVGLTVTSNGTLSELTESVHPAVVRRLKDMCEVLEV